MKHCLYCGRSHDRRARACSDWCERRIRGKVAYVTRSRRQSVARVMAGIQKRARFVPRWRQIAMGDDLANHLPAIFGARPFTGELRHGDTLDA